MFCKSCGAQNPDGQKFCSTCGTPLEQPQAQNQGFNQYNANNSQYGNAQQFNSQQPFNAQPVYGSAMGIQNRSIVTCILLSLVTCGIYGLYWFYTLTEDTNKISGDPNATSGGMAILLTLITCGIYSWYWMYKRGEIIDNYNLQRGMPSSSNAVLYLILSICGLSIVSYCLMQNELNNMSMSM